MKTTRLLVLSILVVLSFGLLWASNSPGNNVPEPQDQINSGSADQQIDLATATRFIANLKSANRLSLSPSVKTQKAAQPLGGFFTVSSVKKVISQPGAVALHYYYGQTDEGKSTLILFGVDSTGKDITTGVIMMQSIGLPCPPYCGGGF